jgi:hypothetical protein
MAMAKTYRGSLQHICAAPSFARAQVSNFSQARASALPYFDSADEEVPHD